VVLSTKSSVQSGRKGLSYRADLTGQANHLGATIEADIVKQKLPDITGGYTAINKSGVKYGKISEKAYTDLSSDHPIDLTRYQVAHCYMGRVRLDQLWWCIWKR